MAVSGSADHHHHHHHPDPVQLNKVKATYRIAIFLLLAAAFFALVPLRFIILLAMMELYTREMPLRKESNYRWLRRLREWWFGIPAAPVQLIKHVDSKKNK